MHQELLYNSMQNQMVINKIYCIQKFIKIAFSSLFNVSTLFRKSGILLYTLFCSRFTISYKHAFPATPRTCVFLIEKMTLFKNDLSSSFSDPFACRTGRPSSEERAAHWWTYPPTSGRASPMGQHIFVSANWVTSGLFKEKSVIIKDLTI